MIQIVFRKKDSRSFSIEKVFGTVLEALKGRLSFEVHEASTRSASLFSVLKNLYHFRKLKGSLYHVTGDIHYAVFAFPSKRTILTIHDCVFLEQASGIKLFLFKKLWLQWPVNHARLITTISEKSKQEIISHTRCKPEKIVVIPDPVSPHIYFHKKEFNKELPSVLFIGTKQNKNFFRAVESLQGISCMLEVVGKLNTDQEAILKRIGARYNNYINITDEELAKRYASCDMVLYPSTYEGFGLPIIEAQMAGRPVVVSNLSPMKEVAGTGACLVDPYDINSIRNGVLKIINDEAYRNAVVENGLNNSKQYLPAKIADEYLRVYTSMHE